ncbi:MAG: pyridoxal phosphate-dependent aminotransferase [Oscillospiraceae bacterium]|nr:pyridoxal phosphate-dependent aminotransferase [Oscillospiraceae bacterium]MBP0987416.1 pyridoxal phosphate-dependent aminotransferase [Oscillospiraceae bacterium]MBQ5340336.1 pyridoxal phosphate-dependent aminotransferase [Oscillospiraceae bacterium]MBQ9907882.1 pyridoxal phosphate-dependent aminotransferase [Oscillospiraceae bacterium]
MLALGKAPSVIRETFEYGLARAKEIGKENVFDFSLGNPSVPAPESVHDTMRRLMDTTDSVQLHGYTSAVGAEPVRTAIAADINKRFNAGISAQDIYMTCGAAASLTVTLHAILCPGDTCMTFAPFFPEYRVFVEAAAAKLVAVPADLENFQMNLKAFAELVSPETKAVIINTPNNPTGVVYTEENLRAFCDLLRAKEKEYGHPIYLLADEPYRELVYDDTTVVPYLPNLYDNAFVCYSYSKSLSLPGERIGYIVVSPKMADNRNVYAAVCGSGRALGFVCAPSLAQRVVADNLGKTGDLSVYRRNRDLLYKSLTEYGYRCIYPDGAFYLWVQALEPDANAFCKKARDYELLLVPSDSFGCEGFIRIAYCVTTEMIERSLPAFKKLAESYGK